MKKLSIAAVLLLLIAATLAQEAWKDEQGRPLPNTDSRRSINGFGGWLLVTSDTDWRAKWEAPSTNVPRFNEANTVARGKQLFVLTFFANPQLNSAGNADVSCDIHTLRPNGTSSVDQKDAICFNGAPKENPRNMYLCAVIIGFVGDPGDPAGEWLVHITLKDNVRHVSLPLKTSFVLQERDG